VDHVAIPVTGDHEASVRALAEIAAAAGSGAVCRHPHVTLLAHTGADRSSVRAALEPVISALSPFVVHAHGYGFFVGHDPDEASLHVPVVRSPALDRLQAALAAALERAGASIAGWTDPEHWSPHITLLTDGLTPDELGAAVARVAGRHHPSWHIPVTQIVLTGGRPAGAGQSVAIPLAGGASALLRSGEVGRQVREGVPQGGAERRRHILDVVLHRRVVDRGP
jgi:2'-5' RNA ligase